MPDEFNPIVEYRKLYDDPRSNDEILQKLQDPANFRKAFPDFDYSAPDADARIRAHMQKFAPRPGAPTMRAAPPPTLRQRIGHVFEDIAEMPGRIGEALGLKPEPSVMEVAARAEQEPLTVMDPSRVMTPAEQERHPILTTLGKIAAGVMEPRNLLVIGAGGGLRSLPVAGETLAARAATVPAIGPFLGYGASAISGVGPAMSAGFRTALLAQGLGSGGEAAKFYLKGGWSPEAQKAATEAGVYTVMGALGGIPRIRPEVPVTRAELAEEFGIRPPTPITEVGPRVKGPGPAAVSPRPQLPGEAPPPPATGGPATVPPSPEAHTPQPPAMEDIRVLGAALERPPSPQIDIIVEAAPTKPAAEEVAPRPVEAAARRRRIVEPPAEAPPTRSVEEIIAGIGPERSARPKFLPDEELRAITNLSMEDARAAGLSRANWMAARAEANRRWGTPEAPMAPPTPTERVHQAINRLIKASDADDAARRLTELQQEIGTIRAPEERAKLADSLERRADYAEEQATEIRRVLASKDMAAEISRILRGREAPPEVSAEQVGIDPRTGKQFVMPEIDPETGELIPRKRSRYVLDVSDPARRNLLNFILSDRPPTSAQWFRDAEGKALQPPQQTPEIKEFVKAQQAKLDQKIAEIRASGVLPTEEDLSEAEKLVLAIQAATGKFFSFKHAGKAAPQVDEKGVVRYPGVGDSQRFWNQVLGRPITSHFAKPDQALIERRLKRLALEADAARDIARTLRGERPATPEEIQKFNEALIRRSEKARKLFEEDPEKWKQLFQAYARRRWGGRYPTVPLERPSEAEVAGASQEAIHRVAAEKSQGVRRIRIDTRSGRETPLIGVDAIDAKAGPFDRIVLRHADGSEELIDQGARAVERRAALPERRVASGPMPDLTQSALAATLREIIKHPEASERDIAVAKARLADLEARRGPEQAPAGWDYPELAKAAGLIHKGPVGPADRMGHEVPEQFEHPKYPGQTLSVFPSEIPDVGAVDFLRSRMQEKLAAFEAAPAPVQVPKAQPTPERLKTTLKPVKRSGELIDETTVEVPKEIAPEAAPSREELESALRRAEHALADAKRLAYPKDEQDRLRDTIRAYRVALGLEEAPPTAQELEGMKQLLTGEALSPTGRRVRVMPGVKPAPRPPQERLKITEPPAGVPGEPVSEERLKDFGAEDLMGMFEAKYEEIPQKYTPVMRALHNELVDTGGPDFIAQELVNRIPKIGWEEAARRYLRALDVYKGRIAVKDPLALSKAQNIIKFGHITPPGSSEAGFIRAGFLLDIANELGKYAENGIVKAKDVLSFVHRFLDRGTYLRVDPKAQDAMFKFRGELVRVEDLGRIAFNDGINAIRALPQDEQLRIIEKYQNGEPMPTPELQGLADILQQLQDRSYVYLRLYRPSLPYWENHLRTFWAKKPNNLDEIVRKFAATYDRAMLRGDAGMLRRRIYATIKEGMDAGGVPATTNLFEMALMDLGRQAQYIHANGLLETLKALGKLVRGEEKKILLNQPERVPDNIVSAWFPATLASGKRGIVRGEAWYMEKPELEMLKTWTDPDWVRNNVIGRALLGFKNIYTPIELFGPFHAVGVIGKSLVLQMSGGLSRAANIARAEGDMMESIRGLVRMVDALRAPYTLYKEGKALREAAGQTYVAWQKYNYLKQNFLATPQGRLVEKVFGPDLDQLVDDLLEGGLRLRVDPNYELKYRRAMIDALRRHEYLKGVAYSPLALIEQMTAPLFQNYIPTVKLAAAAREIQLESRRNAPRIVNGEISREEVVRRAVRRVENTLGEMNWNNFNLSRGVRSLLQLTYRSATWRFGWVDQVKNALWRDVAKELSQAGRYLWAAYGPGGTSGTPLQGPGPAEVTQTGRARAAAKGVSPPQFGPDMLLIATEVMLTASISYLIMQLFAHRAPSSLKDLANPDTGLKDSRGKPIRVSITPFGVGRDIPEFVTNPFGYVTGGQTGFVTKSVEALRNRSYEGQVIGEGGLAGLFERAGHAVTPVPFALSGMKRMEQQGAPRSLQLLSILGLTPARRDLDLSEAEKFLAEKMRRFQVTRTAEEQQKRYAKQKILGAYESGRYDDYEKFQAEAIDQGLLTYKEVKNLWKEAQKPYLVRLAEEAKPADLVDAFALATDDERTQLLPVLIRRLRNRPELYDRLDKLEKPGWVQRRLRELKP